LASYPAGRIDGQAMVENGVADLVGHLVGMAHADGFAGEQISVRIHGKSLMRGLGKDEGVASGRKGVIIMRSWGNVQRDCGFYRLCWIFSRAFAASPRTRRSGSLLCAARTAR